MITLLSGFTYISALYLKTLYNPICVVLAHYGTNNSVLRFFVNCEWEEGTLLLIRTNSLQGKFFPGLYLLLVLLSSKVLCKIVTERMAETKSIFMKKYEGS